MSTYTNMLIKLSSDMSWGTGAALRMAYKNGDGTLAVAQPLEFETQDYGLTTQPVVYLEREQLQVLMDELWNVGVRPTEGTGSAGSLAATQAHLKDMQDIARKALDRVLAPPFVFNDPLGEPVPGMPGWYQKTKV